MDYAAENGYLDVIQWLHENCEEGCTQDVMDLAAARGHLDVVQWLHESCTEGCSTEAMRRTAFNGHFDIVLFLHANQSEGCAQIDNDMTHILRMEVAQWLNARYPGAVNVGALRHADEGYKRAVAGHILPLAPVSFELMFTFERARNRRASRVP